MKKLCAMLLCILLALCASGAMAEVYGDFKVEDPIESDKVTWADGVLTIRQSGLTVSMKEGATTAHRIVVVGSSNSSAPLELTIKDLNIKTGQGALSPLSVSGDVKIILQGSNTLTTEKFSDVENERLDSAAGLQQTGVTVTIHPNAYPDEMDKIATVTGGHLIIACGKAANDPNHVCAESDPDCGRLEATGKRNGAGIGGGGDADAHVTIQGGVITAIGGSSGGAGIGGSERYLGTNGIGYVTIQGGVIQQAEGGSESAGIGGGGYKPGVVRITGGTITNAKGGNQGAGIGAGSGADGYVFISGSAVIGNAKGGSSGNGPGIGGGGSSHGGNGYVIIGGNAVIEKAIGDSGAAGIGSGQLEDGHVIIRDNAVIEKAEGAYHGGAGIGSGCGGNADVTISDNAVIKEAIGRDGGAGIGGGKVSMSYNPSDGVQFFGGRGRVTISGGKVTAISESGNAVGSGMDYTGNDSQVIIEGSARTKIAARAGADQSSAKPLAGSAFDKKTDVTAQTAGQHFFETVASVIDEIVQDLAAGMPVTGDPGSLMGWAALLAASAAGLKLRSRKP